MERFKAMLRTAISQNVHRIVLKINEMPEFTVVSGTNQQEDVQVVDQQWLTSLFNFLFENEKEQLETLQITKGVLSIPNLGKVALIGQKGQVSFLNLYIPPEGDALFQSDWTNLTSPQAVVETEMPIQETNAPQGDFVPSLNEINELESNHAQNETLEPPKIPAEDNFDPLQISEPVASAPAPAPAQEDMSIPTDLFSNSTSAPIENPVIAEEPPPIMPELAAPKIIAATHDEEPAAISSNEIKTPPKQVEQKHTPAPSHTTVEDDLKINFSSEIPMASLSGMHEVPINAILKEMITKKASDLHLTVSQPIIYRIDGHIKRMEGEPVTIDQMEQLVLPIMPESNKKEFLRCSDTDFAYEIPGTGRFRVNVFRDNIGVGAVMRHIPSDILTAEQLGLPKVMYELCGLSKGLVLVTGPTGSGKSTTLAAMIDYINKNRPEHLLTIEDPIEFVHKQHKCLINQREIGKHTDSFGRALKAALREDPDIILIGEMRDLETIHIAIETAETGHLVFGTLHTTTAVSTIDRIIDQFPADQQEQMRMMVAGSLKGVIAQTLLPKIGGGRVAAHEILIPNDAVGNMIREKKNHMIENHMQTQKADGNVLLNESLLKLVESKIVTFEEAHLKAIDKKSLVEMGIRKGIKVKPGPQGMKNAS